MRERKLAKLIAIGIVATFPVFGLISGLISSPSWAVQCAPYARDISGLDLYGAAWTWWHEADGRYGRGSRPAVGAALVFKRSRGMPAGHVAVVTEMVDARTIKVDHANWSRIAGRRGRVEEDVEVIDELPDNDWSQVRVWYGPLNDFGNKVYAVYGFIYPEAPGAMAQTGSY